MALVCETVTADSMADLVAGRDAVAAADLVELRLDGVRDVDVPRALAGRRTPVIITCRPVREGGRFDGSEETRLGLLAQAFARGAEFVDVEWRADRSRFPVGHESRLVLSHHDFSGVPDDLADRVRAMRATRPAVVKIAVTATRLSDCLRLRLDTVNDSRHVAIAMGPAGRLTRVWPAWTGSAWTYSGSAAPGQLSTRDLIDTFRVQKTTAASAAYGIVGSPLGHSASPAMHNAAFAEAGIDAVYVPIETADADEFFEMAAALSLCGASVTAPLKRELARHCEATDEATTSAGAVNTLRQSTHGWEGRNFDTDGFLAPLDRLGAAQAGSTAVILGAGGAARGAAWALAQRGVRVALSARRPEAAADVARDVHAEVTAWPPAIDADLLVNATTVGAWPRGGVSPVETPRGRLAYDLVYNPVETEFLLRARAAGAGTIGGLEMLVEQAARQFEWWTGRAVPRSTFDRAARRFLSSLAS